MLRGLGGLGDWGTRGLGDSGTGGLAMKLSRGFWFSFSIEQRRYVVTHTSMISFSFCARSAVDVLDGLVGHLLELRVSPLFRSSSEKCSAFSDFFRCSMASRRTFRMAIFPSSPNFLRQLHELPPAFLVQRRDGHADHVRVFRPD